jgi:hypothetical protein
MSEAKPFWYFKEGGLESVPEGEVEDARRSRGAVKGRQRPETE